MRKKFVVGLMALVCCFAFGLTACNKEEEPSGDNQQGTTQNPSGDNSGSGNSHSGGNSSSGNTETTPTPTSEKYFDYTVERGVATITGFKDSTATSVVIPSTINTFPVKIIGEEAFKDKSMLRSAAIPEGVEEL